MTPEEQLGISQSPGLPGPQEFEKFLRDRGIEGEMVNKLGFVYLTPDGVSKMLGRTIASDGVGIPYYDCDGNPLRDERIGQEYSRVRLLRQAGQGKYQQPRNTLPHIYLCPVGWDWKIVRDDAKTAVIITEGEFKAIRANNTKGFEVPVIGLGGVDSWGDKEGAPLAPELMQFVWHGRTVFVCFDADEGGKGYKPEVWASILRLALRLKTVGAVVKVVNIHGTEIGKATKTKLGLDDYLAASGTWDALEVTAEDVSADEVADLNQMLAQFAMMRGLDTGIGIYDLAKHELLSRGDFQLATAHRFTLRGDKPVLTAKLWEQSAKKIVLWGFTNDPSQKPLSITQGGKINLWRGFATKPKQLDEVRDLWLKATADFFQDEAGLATVFHNWVASILQQPHRRHTASWVIQSSMEGIGKSLIGEVIAKIIGTRGSKHPPACVLGPDELFSDFNEFMAGSVFVVVNEPSSDSQRHVRAMKSMRSNDDVTINVKYGAKFTVQNYANFWLTTNEAFTHGMSANSRRDIVYRPTTVEGDKGWKLFIEGAAKRLMSEEGRAAILHYYLNEHTLPGDYDHTADAVPTREKAAASSAAEPLPVRVAKRLIADFGEQAIIPVRCLQEVAEHEGLRIQQKLTAEIVLRVRAASGFGSHSARVRVDGERVRVFAYSNVSNSDDARKFVDGLPDVENRVRAAREITMAWLKD